jgi:hypothetical protein
MHVFLYAKMLKWPQQRAIKSKYLYPFIISTIKHHSDIVSTKHNKKVK